MEVKSLLRVLSIVGFLLLVAPFYDHCNGHRMKQVEAPAEEAPVVEEIIAVDPLALSQADSIAEIQNNEVEPAAWMTQAYEFIDDEDSENAFEIMYFEMTAWFETNKDDFSDIKSNEIVQMIAFHIKNFCFCLIVPLTILLVIVSFRNGKMTFYRLARLNLILICTSFLLVFLDGTFENWRQIKWGYYTFIAVQIAIVVTAKKSIALHTPNQTR